MVGLSGPYIKQDFLSAYLSMILLLVVVSLGFQSTCLAFRSPAIKTGIPPSKLADRSLLIRGRESERQTARIFTGLPANVACIAVASRCLRPGIGTA